MDAEGLVQLTRHPEFLNHLEESASHWMQQINEVSYPNTFNETEITKAILYFVLSLESISKKSDLFPLS